MSKRFKLLWIKNNWQKLPHPLRWAIAATVGSTLLLIGVVFLVLPGPGFPLILAGLAILATEFAWAEVVLNRTKHHVAKTLKKVRRRQK